MNNGPVHGAELIRNSMATLGVAYELHEGPSDAVARFSIASGSGSAYTATASIAGGALRFVAHAVLEAPPEPTNFWLFDEVNQQWGFGSVYYDEGAGAFNCAAGLPIVGGRVDPAAVQWTARHLADAADAVRRYSTPVFMPPPARAAVTMQSLAAAAAQANAPFQEVHGGAMLEQQFTEGTRTFRAQFFIVSGVVLVTRGLLIPARGIADNDRAIRAIQRVNAAIGAGSAAVWREPPQPYYQLVVPLAWTDMSPSLIRALIDQVATAVELIDREW